ncbi:MAG: hypothetical protein WBA79_14360 [Mycobacterium sp.]
MTDRGGSSADTTSGEQWPHITRQDVYNIQMALLRNHGYGARRVDAGPDKDPMIHVVDNADRTVLAMKVSNDGLNWVVCVNGGKPFVLPLTIGCADLADRVVAEVRKPH